MAITQSIARLGATLVAIVHTRIELAAIEMEEESQRLLAYLLQGLLVEFLFGMAIMLLAFLVILLFWDSHRIEAVLGLAAMFSVCGVVIANKLRRSLETKPRLLQFTLAE